MKKKIILFSSIAIFFFSLLLFLYFKLSFDKRIIEKKKTTELTKIENLEKIDEKIVSSNIIEDVSYSAKDIKGNEYFLKADEGTIDQNDSNYIFLKSVNAIINLEDYKSIEISSDFGKYDINNYDTIFSKNVIISYLDNKITGEYLDFSLENNLMMISRNVILKNNESSLKADVVELELDTKNMKIFMYEENKRINIKASN